MGMQFINMSPASGFNYILSHTVVLEISNLLKAKEIMQTGNANQNSP